MSSIRESLHIPHAIWVKLEPKLKEKKEEIKREIKKELGSTKYPTSSNSQLSSSQNHKQIYLHNIPHLKL